MTNLTQEQLNLVKHHLNLANDKVKQLEAGYPAETELLEAGNLCQLLVEATQIINTPEMGKNLPRANKSMD